jgi:hypothetical protein
MTPPPPNPPKGTGKSAAHPPAVAQPGTPAAPLGPRARMKDAVEKVMQQVSDQKQKSRAELEAERQHQRRLARDRFLLAAALVLALMVSGWFGYRTWRHPFPPPTGAAAAAQARQGIALTAGLVERHIRATGSPPTSLREIGLVIPGLEYQRIGAQYALSMVVEGRRIQFHSGEDLARFKTGH